MADRKEMVTAVFRDHYNAERAFDVLRDRGYLDSEINVLMSDRTRQAHFADPEHAEKFEAGNMASEGTAVGGAIGTAVGAALAAVAAIGTTLMLPGIGIVIAGPVAAAVAGAGAGAVAGGVIGALVGWGIPETNVHAYEAALRGGGVIIGVTPHNSEDADLIMTDFNNLHGENVVRFS